MSRVRAIFCNRRAIAVAACVASAAALAEWLRRGEIGWELWLVVGAVIAAGMSACLHLAGRLELLADTQVRLAGEVQAHAWLVQTLQPARLLPPVGEWGMCLEAQAEIVAWILAARPRLVVELGSGGSTVAFAYALRAVPDARLVSLDHDRAYAERTRSLLREHGLTNAEVRVAPLIDQDVQGERRPWYDLATVEDLEHIDLLVVDGPPGQSTPEARFPALPLLRSRLSNGAIVALDDAQRPHELRIVARWRSMASELEPLPTRLPRLAGLRFGARTA